MRVVLAGGGTAGHIEPALNTAEALRSLNCGHEISLLGTEKGLETMLVPQRGFQLLLIPPVPLPRRLTRDLFSLPARMLEAVRVTKQHLANTEADVVVGFGGYVSLPAYFAARSLGIPVVVHEANAKPGLANRVGSRFAVAVVETIAGSLPRATHLGLPLRYAIQHFNKSNSRDAGLGLWSLDSTRKTLLAFGGSQGSRHINEEVRKAAPELIARGYQILHSVGSKNTDQLTRDIEHYVTVSYIERMDFAYGVADVAVCRSGAMTVAEMSAVGLPAVYVPYPSGNGEQALNVTHVIQAGGGALILDKDFSAARLLSVLTEWEVEGLASKAAAALHCSTANNLEKWLEIITKAAKPHATA
jgi:UDP-N-acetylglucosamine--N-acetylmuramyl-(pentapeptide) pyrophosphoryl-undecaprenol N-acetylglucosamine transferase